MNVFTYIGSNSVVEDVFWSHGIEFPREFSFDWRNLIRLINFCVTLGRWCAHFKLFSEVIVASKLKTNCKFWGMLHSNKSPGIRQI